MNRSSLVFTFLFFTSLNAFLPACSSSSSSSAGGACASYVAALRDSSKECGRFSVAPSRESEYLARFQRACENALNAPGSGIAPAVLDQCANKIREECGDDDACEDLLEDVRGSLADGTACEDDTQCASGECRHDSDSSAPSRCGTCAPAAQIGQPCPDGGCVAGASCRTTSSSTSGGSVERTCVAIKIVGVGESCGSASESEAIRCASGLYCKYDPSGSSGASTGTCENPLGEGETCGNSDSQFARCKAPFSCVNDRCGRLLAAGQACKESSDCASGLGCDPGTGTCTAITWGANGAECDDNLRRCERGFCARTAGTSGTSETGNCIDYLADGAPCSDGKDFNAPRCDSLSSCTNGTCQFDDPSQCK